MKSTPKLDVKALQDAAKLISAAEKTVERFALACGLPAHVYITEGNYVTLNCGRRVFVGHNGKRNLERGSSYIGPQLWEMIEDAAAAYKTKAA